MTEGDAPGDPAPPRLAAVVRLYLAAIALMLVIGTALAVLMRIDFWDPEMTFGEEAYNRLFTAHGAIAVFGGFIPLSLLTVANLVVVDVLRPTSIRTLPLAWAGFACWLLCAALSAISVGLSTGAGEDRLLVGFLIVAVPGLLALSLGLTAVHLLASIARRGNPATVAGQVAAIGAALCLGLLAELMAKAALLRELPGGDALWTAGVACQVAVVCLWPHAVERAAGRPFGPSWAIVAIPVAFAVPAVSARGGALAIFLGGIIALWLSGRALLARPRPLHPAALFGAIVVLPMLGLAVPFQSFLSLLSPDVPLHDTHFAVAGFHARAFATTAMALTAVLAAADRLGIAYSTRLVRAAAWVLGPSAAVFLVLIAHAGAHGMARRYGAYLAEFQLVNQGATAAAIAFAVGGALLLAAFARRGRPDRRRWR